MYDKNLRESQHDEDDEEQEQQDGRDVTPLEHRFLPLLHPGSLQHLTPVRLLPAMTAPGLH